MTDKQEQFEEIPLPIDEVTDVEERLEEEDDFLEEGSFITLKTGIIVGLIILLLSSVGAYLFFYPSVGKIKGEWENEAESPIELMVDKKGSAELTFTNYGNNQGLTLIFKGKMAGKGINRYQLTELSGLIAYKKDVMTEEEATKIKEDKTYYTFEKETSTMYYFNMTKKGLERFMARDNPERYFVWETHHLPWEKPKLFFKNVLVSEAPMVFSKVVE